MKTKQCAQIRLNEAVPMLVATVCCLLLITVLQHGSRNPNRAGVSHLAAPVKILPPQIAPEHAARSWLNAAYDTLPVSFEANQGQTDSRVKFLSRGPGYSLFLSSSQAVLRLRRETGGAEPEPENVGNRPMASARRLALRHRQEEKDALFKPHFQADTVLRIRLVNANPATEMRGVDELPGRNSYFVGNDPRAWRMNVPQYARVEYRRLYPGIDLIFHGNRQQLEYDFVVAPGGHASEIRMALQGADKLQIDSSGDLNLYVGSESLRLRKPWVYQEASGVKREVAAKYRFFGKSEVGIDVASYDHRDPLVIDPQLSYSALLGGRLTSQANAIAVDAAGNAYVTGSARADFPTVAALQPNFSSFGDAFVTKISPSGTLVYSTFLGGNQSDEGRGIAVDSSGNVYVSGTTQSTNFPVVNAFQPTNRGGFREAFVSKLNASGSALVYSSYLGGTDQEIATAIAADPAGNAYLTGYAQSSDFPTTAGAFQTSFGGGTCFTNRPCADAFVTKVSPNGALAYSTFLGGSGNDNLDFLGNPAGGIATDNSGNAYITGVSNSKNFPTRSPLQAACNQCSDFSSDVFVSKLNPTGSGLLYSTYLGGLSIDAGRAITVDSAGNAFVTGSTDSPDFPTIKPLQADFGGEGSFFFGQPNGDAFVTKINPTGSAIVYSTYLGGGGDEAGYAISVDSSGAAYVTGFTTSPNFPTVNSLQPVGGGGLVKTINGADSWSPANTGLPNSDVNALQIDPVTVSTLYAATNKGVFKSTDAGRNWRASSVGLGGFSIYALLIDPTNPSVLYAGSFGKVYKSTNGGLTWNPNDIGVNSVISTLAIDPTNSATLYGGTSQNGVLKSADSGSTWKTVNNGLPAGPSIKALLVDPAASSTIYAGLQIFGAKAVYKSIDGGNNWSVMGTGLPNQPVLGLAFDPTNSSTLYAVTQTNSNRDGGVFKTTNGGAGWNKLFAAQVDILCITVDSKSNLYIGSDNFAGNGLGILKSDNGGTSWGSKGVYGTRVQSIIIDPKTPSTMYAATPGGSDAFVAVLNPAGNAFVTSTYFGGTGLEEGRGVSVDSTGNIYLAGLSYSADFPALSPIQPSLDGVQDAFVARIVSAADPGQLLGPVPGATWTRFVRVDTNQNGVPDPDDETVTFRYFRAGVSQKTSSVDGTTDLQAQDVQQPTLVIQSNRWGVSNLVLSNPDSQGRYQTATRTTRSGAKNKRTVTATIDAFDSQHRPTSISLRQDFVKGTTTTTTTGKVTTVDANGDGIPEAFTAQQAGQPAVTVSLVYVDVNGDGRPDFVSIPFAIAGLLGAVTGDPQVFIPLGDTNGDGIPDSPAFDFDNDGKPDTDFLMAPFAAGPNATQQQLFFAHFGNGSVPGAQIFSQIMLINLDAAQPAVSRISLADDLGRALNVRLNDDSVSGSKDVTIPPGGMRTLKTDAQGPITAGAVTVSSNKFLAGVILFGGSIGLAGVGSSAPLITSFDAPMEVNSAQAINTGIAMMNLETSDLTADLQLLDTEGKLLATSRLDGANALKSNGHVARFLPEFSWSPSVDFSSFVGILKVTASGRVAATVLQTRPAEFATMPVSPANADVSNQQLYFAHFGNGEAPGVQLFSQIMLINLDSARAATARISLRNDAGQPLTSNLNGEPVAGQKDLVIPAGGMRILKTDAKGPLTAGAVTVSSDRKLAGVIIFGGSLGLAGVGSSALLSNGLVAPMETNGEQVINTGIAMMNLEPVDVTADLQLLDADGNLVATSRLDGANSLKGNGHVARFLQEFSWSPSVDFSKFVGVLKIKPSGRVAATVLQTRPAQFATMPVAPRLN